MEGELLQENLNELDGINVWGQHQETLEQQALQELEIFEQENRLVDPNLEDGEICDETAQKSQTLDLSDYINKQEELKKRQNQKRSLQITDHSKDVVAQSKRRPKASTNKKLKPKQSQDYKSDEKNSKRKRSKSHGSDSDYIPSDEDLGNDCELIRVPCVKQKKEVRNSTIEKVIDDGLLKSYQNRLNQYYEELEKTTSIDDSSEDIEVEAGLKLPIKIWKNMYEYQQDGVKWLWNLHKRSTGGLLGDEMGLGKTVQVIAFLTGLNHSKVISRHGFTGLGPTLIVAPATVLYQWVKHFHEWSPEFRVAILHQSGSYIGNKLKLIKDINKGKGILVTTYAGILKYKTVLLEYVWHYVILDEGHKIRNPSAKVSVAVKKLQTPHRLMLTGSPMQNNLQELWSLFDFIVPGMLGSLQTFLEHFANPIVQGGFLNATALQEATALSVAKTLKGIISPHLLRRAKNEVRKAISLPNKSEQVLFCTLSEEQRDLYKGYLMGEQVSTILGKGNKNWFAENQMRANVLVAITTLRKICNHPDLYLEDQLEDTAEDLYKRSGKMVVVSALLKIWKKQKHRVLLFTQSRGMILVFEQFLKQQGYNYLKMDGSTTISSRQQIIDEFNKNNFYDVFLLTTRVGGLGVNLTGADRVIIYDPDWNPATDTQARERAWRIGQDKQVTIYRLLSAGTIEEKMYQRQVWKQLLSNKILLDVKTQRFFKSSDLHELFSLQEQVDAGNSETANIFKNSRINMQEKLNEKKEKKKAKLTSNPVELSDDKIKAMKSLAQQIAKSIGSVSKEVQKPKTYFEMEWEEAKADRLKKKAYLKTLTPVELREYNRTKLKQEEEGVIANKIDDYDTAISFTKALDIAQETAKLYSDLKANRVPDSSATVCSDSGISKGSEESVTHRKHKKHKKHKQSDVAVDKSGLIDGETVEGLVKTEVKKKVSHKSLDNSGQDEYVLGKLFSKKGVHTALQHDVVVQSGCSDRGNIRNSYEADKKAQLALSAIRKSRYNV